MFAVCVCTKLGIAPCVCKEALAKLTMIEGRCEIIRADITVIIDYAHTPFALKNILKTAKHDKTSGQNLTLVFGCGGNRDISKRAQMAKIAEQFCDYIIVTTDNPRNENPQKIINDIVSGFTKKNYGIIENRTSAITYAIMSALPSDIVIIAGKGHEKYTCDSLGYHYFNEKEIIEKALSARGG
jgi:UDP-N-acetylmuramoyl-L-alanyl-D-glutamate--2,6-diaminopimelate ligase